MTTGHAFESQQTTRPSDIVLSALATHEDCTELDIDTPLYEVIEPDALDKLFHGFGKPDGHSVSVSFSMLGYDIDVHGDGRVYIDTVPYIPDENGQAVMQSLDVQS